MRISEKKHTALFKAITDPIDKLRIENSSGMTIEEMDDRLFKLGLEIHSKLIRALNLTKSK